MQSYAKAEHNDQLKSSSSSNQGLRAHGFLEKNEQRCTVCHMENFSNVRTKQQATQPPVSNGAPMIVHDSAHGADSDSGEVDEAKVLRCRSNCSSPSGGDPPARRLDPPGPTCSRPSSSDPRASQKRPQDPLANPVGSVLGMA